MEQLLLNLTNYVKQNSTLKGADKYLENFDIDKIDLSKFIKFSDKTYKRNLVLKNSKILIMILCWKSGQQSPIHNHPEQGCLMKIITGKLQENRYKIQDLNFVNQKIYKKNDVSYIDNSEFVHKISNIYDL